MLSQDPVDKDADINWSLCCLCQKAGGSTRCPTNNTTPTTMGAGYKTISEGISACKHSHYLPIKIPSYLLTEINIEDILQKHNARFHPKCSIKFRLDRLKKKEVSIDDSAMHISPAKTRRMTNTENIITDKSGLCWFCDRDRSEFPLIRVSSPLVDANVKVWATNIEDFLMLGKLSSIGDMFAHDVVYHKHCITDYYNKNRAALRKQRRDGKVSQSELEGIALAEIVSYINDDESEGPFYGSTLADMYRSRLEDIGGKVPEHRVHTTRLQNRIIAQLPWLVSCTGKRGALYLANEDAVGWAAEHELNRSPDTDAIVLSRAAKLVREHMFDRPQQFEGEFGNDAQQKSVPHRLSALVDMIVYGPTMIVQDADVESDHDHRKTASLSISQLIMFNAVKKKKAKRKGVYQIRHRADRETPLAIYIAMKVHAKTQSNDLVDTLHRLGICVSYERLGQISTELANSVIAMFDGEGSPCGPKLRRGILTIGSADNFDKNPTSRDVVEALHATAIVLTQLPTADNQGTVRSAETYRDGVKSISKLATLPHSYTEIQECVINTNALIAPQVHGACRPGTNDTPYPVDVDSVSVELNSRHVDINTVPLEMASDHVDANAGYVETNTVDVEELNSGQIELTTVPIEVDSVHVAVNSGQAELTTVPIEVDSVHVAVNSGQAELTTVPIEVDSVHVAVSFGQAELTTVPIEVDSVHVAVNSGQVELTTVPIDVTSERIVVNSSHAELSSFAIGVDSGQVVMVSGQVEGTTGNVDTCSAIPSVDVGSGHIYSDSIHIDNVPLEVVSTTATTTRTPENEWIDHACEILKQDTITNNESVSWAAFHAAKQPPLTRPRSITSMLPILRDKAATPSMIAHAMTVIKAAVDHLNPGQTPVIALDQPLYALAKALQWSETCIFNEDNYVIMLGSLHTEMLIMKLIGKWLEDSGWTSMLTEAEVTTSGRAESIINASHVTRTRYCHQVTALSLAVLRQEAYVSYISDCSEKGDHPLNFDCWCNKVAGESPQFKYWQTAYNLEIMLLRFVRSIREGDFQLYIQTMADVVPWCFILGHYHYARWLPVHIRDMLNISLKHPELHNQFNNGYFTVAKTQNAFSMIGLDHNHEQENKTLKLEGGSVDFTEECAFTKWLISSPEIARVIGEFEAGLSWSRSKSNGKHHDQSPTIQRKFADHTKSLVKSIRCAGNPFKEDTRDVVVLDTKQVMDEEVAIAICNAEENGKHQYVKYVEERLEQRAEPIMKPMTMNKIPLPGNPRKKGQKQKSNTVKDDLNLLGQLYIALQVRDGNADRLFEHENADIPPSLSKNGQLRGGHKADLLQSIETESTDADDVGVDAKLIDGAAMVHFLRPLPAQKTFTAYAKEMIVPYIQQQLISAKRVDIIWDRYIPNSLKETARGKLGKGARIKVTVDGKLPKNWESILRDNNNKSELFVLIADVICHSEFDKDKVVISTWKEGVVVSPAAGPDDTVIRSEYPLSDCNHEEFDTRVMNMTIFSQI